jgi:hypothetical protein
MPIDPTQVPVLIKTAETKKLEGWKRDYFEKVAKTLQVHTKGQMFSKVDTLFPNEHPDSKAHCIATYEPITKSSIWKGINNLLRIFSSSSFSFEVGEELNEWLEEYEYDGHNLLNYFLNEWVGRAVAEDPNGLFVVYPPDWAEQRGICPIQWVRSELIKSRPKDGQTISFISEIDSEVRYYYENVVTKREVFYDDTIGKVNARSWTETTYNERLKVKVEKPVVHLFTLDGFIVYRNSGQPKEFDIQTVNFADPMSALPVFPGGGAVADKADQLLFESFVQAFVPFGNLALLQHRNHRAVDLQFSYPRMMELQVPCDYQKCQAGYIKCTKSSMFPEGKQPCPKCKGSSYVTVQSPYKVYQPKYDPNDSNENKHLQTDPVKFFSPDVAIIDYSKNAWKDYLKQAEDAIFVQQKAYTAQVQSAESKEIDMDELYAWLNNVSKVFYNNLRQVLQALEDYMSRTPVAVTVERPYSYAILTEGEAFIALNNILTSKAPIFVKGNRVDEFVRKFVSKDSPVNKALGILKQYDPLLYYAIDEVQTFKSANTITQEMWTKHVLAYPMLLKLYEQDRNLFDQPLATITTQLDTEIAAFKVPAAGSDFRQSVLASLQQPGEEGAAA